MKVAVIILNWNGIKLLEEFLPTLVRYSNNNAQIYMIDNKSTDHSVEYVSSNFPLINIVQNKENYGYAKGYNEGLKKIDADVYCLLNNDVEVTENWLEPLIKEFKSNQNTAVAQPKILNYNQREYFDYAGGAGGYIDRLGFPYCDGRVHNIIEKDVNQYDFNKDVFWASGACFFIRKSVFYFQSTCVIKTIFPKRVQPFSTLLSCFRNHKKVSRKLVKLFQKPAKDDSEVG